MAIAIVIVNYRRRKNIPIVEQQVRNGQTWIDAKRPRVMRYEPRTRSRVRVLSSPNGPNVKYIVG